MRRSRTYDDSAGQSFADKYYADNIRGKEDILQHYQILHLSNLNIDMKYAEGAETDCGEFRCCHLNKGQNATAANDRAGPLGARGCDLPLNGVKAMLTKLKERAV